MADQVIIEFVGDTSSIEEAYNKLNEKIENSFGLNKESAAALQKFNSSIL